MNILQRRRTKVLDLDFWEKQYKSIIDKSITKLIVPDGATAIKGYSLNGCSLLRDIQWANTITSIGGYSFQNCINLTSVEIPASVSSIGTYAFASCTNLRNVTIPSSVRSIGDFAFTTSGIINLTISEGVTSLGQQCFASNTALVNLVIPDSVTTLGNAPFRQCSGLKNITIGSGITSLVNEMFWTAKPDTLTMRRTTPPTALANNFQTWPTHIYVPYSEDHSVLNAYKAASVWSTYADRIEEIPT